jgi:pSer/pThr/pTyr-binding forkhead associated (FHA) protein
MTTCPICKNTVDADSNQCPTCGYRFHDTTQEFQPVELKSQPNASESSASSEASLVVCYGKQEGIVYKLEGDEASIGRSPKCEVFLNDMTVSRDHALLEKVADVWTIKDNGSFNGVWVNNKNIDHVVLNDGDLIQIGCFVLRFRA